MKIRSVWGLYLIYTLHSGDTVIFRVRRLRLVYFFRTTRQKTFVQSLWDTCFTTRTECPVGESAGALRFARENSSSLLQNQCKFQAVFSFIMNRIKTDARAARSPAAFRACNMC